MDFLCKNTLNVADFLKAISSGLNLYWMPTRETDTSLMPKLRVLTVGERVLKISTYFPAVWSLLCTDDNVSPGTDLTHTDWLRNPPDITQKITHSIIHISYLSPKEQQMIKFVLILCVWYSFSNVLSYHIAWTIGKILFI